MNNQSSFSVSEWTQNKIKFLENEIARLKEEYKVERAKPDRYKKKLEWIEKDILFNQNFLMRLKNIVDKSSHRNKHV